MNKPLAFTKLFFSLSSALFCASTAAAPPLNNPYLGLHGAAAMHGDAAASDTTPLAGPSDKVSSSFTFLNGTCATMLVHSEGNPIAICTDFTTRSPKIQMLDPDTQEVLTESLIPSGSTFGGIYGYINHKDQIVMAEGSSSIIFVNTKNAAEQWALEVTERIDLSLYIPNDEYLNAINPAADGSIWFATDQALIGRYDPFTKKIKTRRLGRNETIQNSFANSGDGKVAVATDKALYLLEYKYFIKKIWRKKYDHGSHRKPGKLSQGTGSSPTFFGPVTGTEYVTIADNADEGENLLIYSTKRGIKPQICKLPLPSTSIFASENSPIGIHNTVIISSTYGYPYPIDDQLAPSIPKGAPIEGGMYRVDVIYNKKNRPIGCELIWQNTVKSAAVPKLSLVDNIIYTIENLDDIYQYTTIDFNSGSISIQQTLGTGWMFNTLQLAGNIDLKQTLWQGTTGGVIKISSNTVN